MKHSIHGFSQSVAVGLGLDSNDLLILRWFVDFAGTDKMRTMLIDNKIYYWINYDTVLKELPILKITKQTLYKKHFISLCNAKVLEHKQVKQGGNFSYYCYGINYSMLVFLQDEVPPLVKKDDLMSEFTQGSVETYQTLAYKHTEPLRTNIPNKDSSIINPSINDSINNISIESLFDEFWKIYPRKVSKANAFKAYKTAVKGLKGQALTDMANTILKGLEGYIAVCKGRDVQYISHASSWLNGKRWEDDNSADKKQKQEPACEYDFSEYQL